jgi:hypothetical protein
VEHSGAQAIGSAATFFHGGNTTPLSGVASFASRYTASKSGAGRQQRPLVVIPFVASYDMRVATPCARSARASMTSVAS